MELIAIHRLQATQQERFVLVRTSRSARHTLCEQSVDLEKINSDR
jgi:hypothetical protein